MRQQTERASLHPLENSLFRALPPARGAPIYIAYSGGMDSTILLHCCLALRREGLSKAQFAAWHINHQLLPAANEWEAHCVNQCSSLDLPIKVSRLRVSKRGGESTEMAARRCRYALWEEELPAGALLLQAHHQRDQAEILLLRLLRGSRFLRAIPRRRALGRGFLVRPLLGSSYSQISHYQQEKSLLYIADPSNEDTEIERNFIRHQLLPLVSQKWPAAEASLAQGAARLEAQNEIVTEWTRQLPDQLEHRLSVAAILAMKPARAELLINAWLQQLSLAALPCSAKDELLKQLRARADSCPSIQWDGVEMHRYRGYLYAMPTLPEISDKEKAPVALLPAKGGEREYPVWLGSIVIKKAQPSQPGQLMIGYRQGGESIQLSRRRRSLKRILQENHIPPWLRPYVPLIYHNDSPVAVVGINERQKFLIDRGIEAEWKLAAQYGAKQYGAKQ